MGKTNAVKAAEQKAREAKARQEPSANAPARQTMQQLARESASPSRQTAKPTKRKAPEGLTLYHMEITAEILSGLNDRDPPVICAVRPEGDGSLLTINYDGSLHPCCAFTETCYTQARGNKCPLANLPATVCPSFLRKGYCDRRLRGKCDYKHHAFLAGTDSGGWALYDYKVTWRLPDCKRTEDDVRAAAKEAYNQRKLKIAATAEKEGRVASANLMVASVVAARTESDQQVRDALAGRPLAGGWAANLRDAGLLHDSIGGLRSRYLSSHGVHVPERRRGETPPRGRGTGPIGTRRAKPRADDGAEDDDAPEPRRPARSEGH